MGRDALDRRWGFFIGPDKAGSSWVQSALERHPRVTVPAAKDLFYFDRFSHRSLDWYLDHFETTDATEVCVEVCHDYLFDPAAITRIAGRFPKAQLLVCARNPVERAVSAYLYMRRQGRTQAPFDEAIRSIDELWDHGRYHHHLRHVLDHFAREQVRVLDFDELVCRPQEFADTMFAALEVEPATLDDDLHQPVRGAAKPRSVVVSAAGKQLALAMRVVRAERLLGRLKSSPAVERALFRPIGDDERPRPTDDDLTFLRERLHDDAVALDDLLGTDYAARWWGR